MKDSVAIAKRSGFKDRMILIDAFNEWTEQAVMEPSDIYGLGCDDLHRGSQPNPGDDVRA